MWEKVIDENGNYISSKELGYFLVGMVDGILKRRKVAGSELINLLKINNNGKNQRKDSSS